MHGEGTNRAATDFLVGCPFPRCAHRLGIKGLTRAHVDLHVRTGGIADIVDVLVDLWHHHASVVRAGLGIELGRGSSLLRAILDELSPTVPLTLGDVAERVGERPNICRTALVKAIRAGVVVQVAKGSYVLAGRTSGGGS